MKLIWKFFFSIMIVIQLCISIGGFYLIQSQFEESLKLKQEESILENDTLYYLFNNRIKESLDLGLKEESEIKKLLYKDFSMDIIREDIMFTIIYNRIPIIVNNVDREFIDYYGNTVSYGYPILTKVIQYEDNYYVTSSTCIEKDDMTYFINNYMNIDGLFITKNNQLKLLSNLIAIEFVISGAVILILSHRLSKPIKELSIATRKLAKQEYDVEVPIKRYDEIGNLAKDFYDMSKQIENNIIELKDINRRQETFINNFTHELKTPLTSIIGYADRLRSKKLSEEEIVLSANHIVTEGKRLESISKKLMQLIILKNDQFVFYRIHSNDFFDSILDIVRPVFSNIKIEIEDDFIYIEPDLMKNAILNIIDNSIHACDNDGMITIKGYKQDNNYVISIEDTGKGMSQDDVKKIKEPFYMVDKSRTRSHGGSGLGLVLVQSIIDLHNADITFDSELGVGTKVTVILKEDINHG